MSKYLFIETRDPFESNDTNQLYGLIRDLSEQGHEISFFLIQNGVFATRKNASINLFPKLLKEKNITIYADDYSIEERGITRDDIHEKILISGSDKLAELTMEVGRKPVWH